MLPFLGYISGILTFIAIVPYIRDIIRHKTRPARASWLIWSILGVIACVSQFAKGADNSLWFSLGDTIAVMIVFLLGLKYGVGGVEKKDIVGLVGAVIGLYIWYLTSDASWAIIIIIIIDTIGSILTIIKSYHHPQTETVSTWLIFGIAGVLGAVAVGEFKPILLAYPIYIAVANFITVLVIISRKTKKS